MVICRGKGHRKTRRREPAGFDRNGGRSGEFCNGAGPRHEENFTGPGCTLRWGRSLSRKTLMSRDWGWLQNLSYRRGYIEAKRREPFSCAWWADEEVCELGFLHGGNFLGAGSEPSQRNPPA